MRSKRFYNKGFIAVLTAFGVFAFASCSEDKAPELLTQRPANTIQELPFIPPPPPPPPPSPAAVKITAVKLRLPNGEERAVTDRPIARCSKVEATLSAAADAATAVSLLSVTQGDASVDGSITLNEEGTIATFSATNCFGSQTTYTIKAGGDVGDVSFTTATHGDINGDGIPDFVVGAPTESATIRAVYVYSGADMTWEMGPEQAITKIVVNRVTVDEEAMVVEGLGDVSGDGYADILIGIHDSASQTGRAFIFSGKDISSRADMTSAHAWRTINGPAASSQFGFAAAGVGDIDRDGFSETMISAPFVAAGGTLRGCAYLFSGKKVSETANVTPADAKIVTCGQNNSDYMGKALAGVGDINGDGTLDVAVGSYSAYGGRGQVVILSGATLFSGSAPEKLSDLRHLTPLHSFGTSIQGLGDMNGDGHADIFIGAYADETFRGKAYIYWGSILFGGDETVRGPDDAQQTLSGSAPMVYFGFAADTCDITRDGTADFFVTKLHQNDNRGEVSFIESGYIVEGADFEGIGGTLNGDQDNDVGFGSDISCIGDIDGDGISEILVGVAGAGAIGTGENHGAVYIYSGAGLGLGMTDPWTIIAGDTSRSSLFGRFVSSAGSKFE